MWKYLSVFLSDSTETVIPFSKGGIVTTTFLMNKRNEEALCYSQCRRSDISVIVAKTTQIQFQNGEHNKLDSFENSRQCNFFLGTTELL